MSSTAHTPSRRPQGATESLRILNVFAVSLLQQRSVDDLFWSIAENVGDLLGFEDCVVYRRMEDGLHQVAAHGVKNPSGRAIKNRIVLPLGVGIVGNVAVSGVPRIVDDTSECPEYVADDYPGASEIAVPVIYDGEVIAVLDSESDRIGAFDDDDLRMLHTVANIAAPRIATALEEEQRSKVEAELKLAKDELEARVGERTRELAHTVRTLETEIRERNRAESELETERHLLRVTLDSISDGIFATDGDGRVLIASEAALRMTGWSREDALGRPLQDVYVTYDEEREERTALAEPVAGDGELSMIRRLEDRQGERRLIAELVSTMRDANGGDVGSVVVFRDITLRRALHREARKAQRMESLGMLAGGIAHDFNNVLTGILGRISLAQHLDASSELFHASLKDAEDGCIVARGLTKELLAFAKGGTPVKKVGSLAKLIRECVSLCLHGTSVTVDLVVVDDLAYVEMDAVQITQVLNNLILNALQAMPEGGTLALRASNGRGLARVGIPDDQDVAVVTIRDQGSGIAEKDLERVFDPYFTTKGAHSGLGLATSYWIVQRHGGELRVLETSDTGSTFELRLPATRGARIEEAPPSERADDSPRLRVLVMDDEPVVRRTVETMLERIGQDVVTAASGEEALEHFERAQGNDEPFDAALLDLTVRGGMGGLRTLVALRKKAPELPAIVMSGYSDDAVLANFAEHGFFGRLEKPFTLTQLRTVIAAVAASRAR